MADIPNHFQENEQINELNLSLMNILNNIDKETKRDQIRERNKIRRIDRLNHNQMIHSDSEDENI